ncbi:MAG TPA: carbohydrate kinase family protein [Flavobacterium sp.]|uniref:carbohydrate kinase family protein n=1 Tax=Flavobacterium sp. TaxID=239 RepID=UPI002DBF8747|nr:carbohydrate kinase family protein [Flavobacterium sp.]HEU4789768.1 carbohydrate kinase family protein [Flavobacterium sp.]
MEKTIDIICVGELLIDFIGHQVNAAIRETEDYHRYLGGSPTNVASYAASLGLKSVLVATCGKDGLGDFSIQKLQEKKVITTQIAQSDNASTSIILVSKSTGTPDFIPYRDADFQIMPNQITEDLLKSAKIYHTTCFALSKKPAQETIVENAKKAKALGLQTSIDINFSERIWPDREEANKVLSDYLATNPFVKLSEDDCYRLFAEVKSEDFIFNYFHGLGASTICLTRGGDGVVLSDRETGIIRKQALPVAEIKDATGAGDAFWTGFLYAQLQNRNLEDTITIAQRLAVLKLQNIGGLPDGINILSYLNANL